MEYVDYIGIALIGCLVALIVAVIVSVWPASVRRDAAEWVERILK